ncbi:MscL family protein [Nocardioides sp.]|uniref:large conductance mechanosensitive channel protein MscL n=1 Tax=Nocardioides sp. TaxID=35761 RepID=UPI0039E312F4
MDGFKKFLLRGNLVDIAVGLIMATAFAKVVDTFVNWLTAQLPDSAQEVFGNVQNSFGAFLNAIVSFVIIAAVVYFLIVTPYTKAKERYFPDPEPGATELDVLKEIRDSLATKA